MSPEEFARSLNVRTEIHVVADVKDRRFERAFELINKTNQYNTTGERWTLEQMSVALRNGVKLYTGTVQDNFTAYGLVVVAIVQRQTVVQFVMSCRVLGLKVERTMLSAIAERIGKEGHQEMRGVYKSTNANHLSATLFQDSEFKESSKGEWIRSIKQVERAQQV
jgi:FkbH-like protein